MQPRYNLLFRQIERELLPLCAEDGVGVIAYNPIAGGLLSGKHCPTARRRLRGAGSPSAGPGSHVPGAVLERARVRHGRGAAQARRPGGVSLVTLSVAWVLANPAITAPIIGASRPEQLDASLAAAEYALDPDLKRQLDELTHEYRIGDAAR